MKKPTQTQIDARRASFEKLLDGPGGEKALQDALAGWLDGDKLFFILKRWTEANTDAAAVVDFYDAIETFCELDLDIDGNPWRLVRYDEVLDPDVHINRTDRGDVSDAAAALNMVVFEDEKTLNREVLEGHSAIEYSSLFDKMLEERGVTEAAEAVAKDVASDTYAFEELDSWFELYGMELRRRVGRVG